MSKMTWFIALALLSQAARADFIEFPIKSQLGEANPLYAPIQQDAGLFVTPNEMHPEHARDLWSQTIEGIYLSVGSERGFIGAAYSNATHLLLVDTSQEVSLFNRLNILLLRLSEGNLERYRGWRMNSSLSGEINSWPISTKEKDWLREILDTGWWQGVVREFSAHESFIDPHSFKETHYLRDERAFRKLVDMAKNNRIQAEQIELSTSKDREPLISALLKSTLKLAVVDLSNAWWQRSDYIGMQGTRKLLLELTPRLQARSMIIVTDMRRDHEWLYAGAHFQDLEKRGFFTQDLVESFVDRDSFLKAFYRLPHPLDPIPPACADIFSH